MSYVYKPDINATTRSIYAHLWQYW